jgi:stalled ribosome alternative rescue factor ArfA
MSKKKNKTNKAGTINMMELTLNQRKFRTDINEIGRGVGVQKPKTGKGSYTRKSKHKKSDNYDKDNYRIFLY